MFFNFGGDDDGFPGFGGGRPGRGGAPRGEVDNTKLYKSLEISQDASSADIKKAYRKLAIKHHPDKGGDEEKFKEISRAYEVLSDPEKRKKYDQFGEEGLEEGGGGGAGHAQDIFSAFFGGGGGPRGQQRKPKRNVCVSAKDFVMSLDVPLEQFYNGATRKLRINRKVIDESAGVHKCPECDGAGVVIRTVRMGPMIQRIQQSCPACNGAGYTYKLQTSQEILEVNINKGMRDGEKVVFKEKADEKPDHDTGDVIIVLQEKPHDVFKRKGADLYMSKSITLLEALTGFRIPVTHMDSRRLLIKTKPGEVVRPRNNMVHQDEHNMSDDTHHNSAHTHLHAVKGEGMPSAKNPFMRGNLFIMLDIEFPKPKSLDKKTIKKLKDILPPPENPLPESVDTDDSYEHHFVEDLDPAQSAAEAKKQSTAYDDDDEDGPDGMRGPGMQSVQCNQQ